MLGSDCGTCWLSSSLLQPLYSESVSTERGAGVAAAVCLHSFVTMMDNTELRCVQL